MKQQIIWIVLVSQIAILLLYGASFADTINLVDGTLLSGKILKETDAHYIFANSHGTFRIKKEFTRNAYITKDYKEDVEINKKFSKKVNELVIEKNYLAGVKKWEKIENDERSSMKDLSRETDDAKKSQDRSDLWNYGRISLGGTYHSTILSDWLSPGNNINTVLPDGLDGYIAYDQGLDGMAKKRHPMMFGLRFEGHYLYLSNKLFTNRTYQLSGYQVFGGPMWTFPSLQSSWGCIVLSGMAGMSFIDIFNRESGKHGKSNTFTAGGLFGYEYSFKVVSIALHFRYVYIYDKKVAFHSIGGSVGIGFRLW